MSQERAEEVLRKAYLNDGLSTTEIAKRNLLGGNFSSGKIYSMLKKFKIPLRSISESVSMSNSLLPRDKSFLDEALLEWIDGFLLGDGYIGFRKSDFMGARLVIGSTTKEWTHFAMTGLAAYRPSPPDCFGKPSKRRPNATWSSRTLTHPDIVEQAKRWYPNGKKIVPRDVRVTPVSLLLWYLGDGSLFVNHKKNITVLRLATCSFQRSHINGILLPKLRGLGLDCARQKSKNDIVIKSNSVGRFFEIIGDRSPFKAYQYKFDMPEWLGLKRLIDIVKTQREAWRAVWHIRNGSVEARKSPGGRYYLFDDKQASDLRRLLDSTGSSRPLLEVVNDGRKRKRNGSRWNTRYWNARWFITTGRVMATNSMLSAEEASKLSALLDEYGENNALPEEMVEQAFVEARAKGFPYVCTTNGERLASWGKLVRGIPSKESGSYHWLGNSTPLATSFHPHIYECRKRGHMSPLELFNSDVDLKRAIRKAFCLYGKVNGRILNSICRNEDAAGRVGNFPPRVGKAIIMDLFNGHEDLTVLDPCAGFSGRLIACAGSGLVKRYLGIDVSEKTCQGLVSSSEFVASVGCPMSIDIRNADCAKELNRIDEKFDLVITSPPFFNVEEYVGVPTPSQYGLWVNDFLDPMIAGCSERLRSGGRMALYLEDDGKHEMRSDCSKIADSAGLVATNPITFTMNYRASRKTKNNKNIDILTWEKP